MALTPKQEERKKEIKRSLYDLFAYGVVVLMIFVFMGASMFNDKSTQAMAEAISFVCVFVAALFIPSLVEKIAHNEVLRNG